MGTTALNADGVKALATLPSLDELRAKLVGMIADAGNPDRPDRQRAGGSARPRVRRLCPEGRGGVRPFLAVTNTCSNLMKED